NAAVPEEIRTMAEDMFSAEDMPGWPVDGPAKRAEKPTARAGASQAKLNGILETNSLSTKTAMKMLAIIGLPCAAVTDMIACLLNLCPCFPGWLINPP
ncbi:unnamed protein product, partial [Prorocentrum cordatum]